MTDWLYCRTSTSRGQTPDVQEYQLRARYPDANLVAEVASGAKERPALAALMTRLEPGDRLVVAALDRLGRRTTDVLRLIESLEERGVILISVREGVDYSTPVGRLVTQILVSVAEMERSQISARTKAGLAHARANGKRLGPPKGNTNRRGKKKSHDPVFIERLLRLSKKLTHRELARELALSTGTVSRMLRRYSTGAAKATKQPRL